MSKEFDTIIKEEVQKRVEEFNGAMAIGNYKRANELLDFLFLPFTEKNKKNESLEDIMVVQKGKKW